MVKVHDFQLAENVFLVLGVVIERRTLEGEDAARIILVVCTLNVAVAANANHTKTTVDLFRVLLNDPEIRATASAHAYLELALELGSRRKDTEGWQSSVGASWFPGRSRRSWRKLDGGLSEDVGRGLNGKMRWRGGDLGML